MQGLSFTGAERRALWFLLALLALGAAVRGYRRFYPPRIVTHAVTIDSTRAAPAVPRNDPAAAKLEAGIDPNVAPAEDLVLLPGVGPSLARAIVAYRQQHGRFRRAEDLLAVPGIGPRTLARFRSYLTLP
jgi:competence ComEA-like helix-hairpin-helix protein